MNDTIAAPAVSDQPQRTRAWWVPAIAALITLVLLAAATGLTFSGYLSTDRYGWYWPGAVGGAALVAASLLVIAAVLRERTTEAHAEPAAETSTVDDDIESSTVDVPGWAGGPDRAIWGGERADAPPATEPEEPPAEDPSADGSSAGAQIPVRGYVFDAAGAGIGDAVLTLIDPTGEQVDRCRAESDGWYELAVPDAGTYTLIARSPGYQPHAGVVLAAAGADQVDLDLVLAGTATLAGTVHAPDTNNAAGASDTGPSPRAIHTADTIRVAGTSGPNAITSTIVGRDMADRAGTGLAGQDLVGPDLAGLDLAALDLAGHGMTGQGVAGWDPAGPGAEPGPGRHAMPGGAGDTLTAQRRDVGGAGVAGAIVALVGAAGQVCCAGRADRSGRYRFDELVTGSYTLVVHAAGYRPVALPVAVPATGSVEGDVVLGGAVTLTGTARAAHDHRVLPDTRVTLLDAAGTRVAEVTTGPDGRYRFDNLTAGDYAVVASGFPPVTVGLRLDAGSRVDHDVTLSHGVTVAV